MPEQDTELLARVVKGDTKAFDTLCARYREPLRLYCARLLPPPEDSDGAVQEALLRVWDRARTFRGECPVRSWVYRIATNHCHDVSRRRKRIAYSLDDPQAPAPAPGASPFESVENRLVREACKAALRARLTERDWQIAVFRAEEWTYARIGELVGLSGSGVKKRYERTIAPAMAEVRRLFHDERGEEA